MTDVSAAIISVLFFVPMSANTMVSYGFVLLRTYGDQDSWGQAKLYNFDGVGGLGPAKSSEKKSPIADTGPYVLACPIRIFVGGTHSYVQ